MQPRTDLGYLHYASSHSREMNSYGRSRLRTEERAKTVPNVQVKHPGLDKMLGLGRVRDWRRTVIAHLNRIES